MAFKGTLKEFKVPDILQLISLQKKTGILTFTSTDGFITLIFEQGMIIGVDSFPKKLEMRVGNVLVKQDFISEEMLQRALTIQKRTNQKIGEILVGMGLVDEDTISESLKTQAVEIVLSLFKWKKGEYNFKIMERLDRTMRMVDPIQTDNLIMEGVQMLDEWPLIKKLIPEETLIFEPVPVESKDIEIIDEYDEEGGRKEADKIYLTETEANLLKYINGENTVQELAEMGVFTEYKVYKSLFNLINKSIIRVKQQEDAEAVKEERITAGIERAAAGNVNHFFRAVLVILLALFALSFFKPLKPLNNDNVILKVQMYKDIFPGTVQPQPKDGTTGS